MLRHILLLAALPCGAWAAPVICVAETQCRGDAERMCAPSRLQIEVQAEGARAQLWIDRQGPYAARAEEAEGMRRWRLLAFDGHWLDLAADGGFTYHGNRGKRFTGYCTGGSDAPPPTDEG